MRTNTRNRNSKPIAMLAMTGMAMGLGTAAHAQLTEDTILTQLESSTFSTVAPTEEMKMYGVLRDFPSWHPDFGMLGATAIGQYAGNVSFFADSDHKPVYLGTGSEVATQWRNKNGQPIAPHLAQFGNYNAWPDDSGVYSTGYMSISQFGFFDSYDSSLGTYDQTKGSEAVVALQSPDMTGITSGQNVTIAGTVLIGPGGDTSTGIEGVGAETTYGTLTSAPDPQIVVIPVDIGASVGHVTWSGTMTINSDIHVDSVNMESNTHITIDGHIKILVEGPFSAGQFSSIELAPNSSLEVYTLGDFQAVAQSCKINAITKDPSLMTFYHLGGKTFAIAQSMEFYGTIYAPGGMVDIAQDSQVFGRVLAQDLKLGQNCAIHFDKSLGTPTSSACGILINDTEGTYAGVHNGGVFSDFSFRTWFRNVPGLNATEVVRLPMKGDGTGTYEHTTADFTIADGQLLGNEGGLNNRYFTYEVTAVGQYSMCSGQFFEFTGDGDVWVMINDKLVIDLGGQSPGKYQVAEMDRMGFSDGELFTFRFFYAQRTGSASPFSMRTNIDFVFSDSLQPDSSGLYD